MIKSNLLYDATTTLNIGAEFRLGENTTFELPVNYNPWSFSDNKKLKHVLVQPEVRFWFCESFIGHFMGVHAHYSYYNIGGIDLSESLDKHRYEGWLTGGGFSYGYAHLLSERWSIEATIGFGYAYMNYGKYECVKCGEKISSHEKHYFGPTKIAFSIAYAFY